MSFVDFFNSVEDEGNQFDKIENPLSSNQQLCAFMYLHQLFPNEPNIIAKAEFDHLWVGPEDSQELESLTLEQVTYLVRCGIYYCEHNDSLVMYV